MATNAPVRPRPAPPREVAPKAPEARNDAPSRAVHAQDDWTSTARRMWLWPVAILLSVPIGGYIADLVINGVDSVGTALAGGLIAGAVIGAAGWFVLRQRVSWLWIPATMVGMAVGPRRGSGAGGLRDRSGRPSPHGCRYRPRRRGVAGAGAHATRDRRCVLVGGCEPACLGARLARDFLRDHGERRGAVCGLRRERCDRLRRADVVDPRSAVPGDGIQDRGKAGGSRSVTKAAGAEARGSDRRATTRPDAVRQGGLWPPCRVDVHRTLAEGRRRADRSRRS